MFNNSMRHELDLTHYHSESEKKSNGGLVITNDAHFTNSLRVTLGDRLFFNLIYYF